MKNLTNGVGTIDSQYKDEIKVLFHNHSSEYYSLRHHDKIAQFHLEVVIPTTLVEVMREEQMEGGDRAGGFGSTGK